MRDTEIDDLPDGVLAHILSFFRTKEAVQTSEISKRWRNLWRFSSRIDLDEKDFRYCDEKFLDFGDMVLCRREPSYLDTFSMDCINTFYDEPSYSDICRRWINSAIKLKPRVCRIQTSVPDNDFVACIFTCESIQDMSLDIHITKSPWDFIIPATVNLPHIKRLRLKRSVQKEGTATKLFKGCPKLEYLKLKYCSGDFSPIFRQKLIRLSLVSCSGDLIPKVVDLPCIKMLCIKQLKVDEESIARLLTGCPLLENLTLERCSGNISNPFRSKIKCLSIRRCTLKTRCDDDWTWVIKRAFIKFNLSGDAKIYIACTLAPLKMKFIWKPPIGTHALDFRNNFDQSIIFSGAECLKLCFRSDTKDDWMNELPKMGAFNNLKRLSLRLADCCMHRKSDPVVWFLRKSPNIEELALYHPKRKIKYSKKGNPKSLICQEFGYYIYLTTELFKFNLKKLEIKFCKNLFGAHDEKEALLRQIEYSVTAKVVISQY
ncbi:F-box family protein [Rhynchospora pubera]|uniref:F-box family protein n=1 Tax=Rhynchospora pubera TaxID=906938 RepID=A0AAV8DQ02_9POAL|nr:F-box family protein [Rhynchospora pubera]